MEEDTSKCVVVRGFPIVDGEQLEELKDKLQIYFQSTKDSGGGDVGHLELVEPGLMKIQFVEEEAAKNVLSRTQHQINVFGKDCPLDVLPYSPSPTQLSHPYDAGQPGSTVGAYTSQDERPGNEPSGQQPTDDPGAVPHLQQTAEVPNAPTSNPYQPYGYMPPTYPHPGYGPPTYPSSHANQPIPPGYPSMGIQEADSPQPLHDPPSYGTVGPGDMAAPLKDEGHSQTPEDSQASVASPGGVSNPHLHPQNPYPVQDHRGPHGEIHPKALQGQTLQPAGGQYPNPAFQGSLPHPQAPAPGQPPTYPGDMTQSKEMQPASDGEGPLVSAPPKGVPNPNYSPQNTYQVPVSQGSHGESHPTTHHQGQNQPPAGVPYPNPIFQGPYPQAQTPGPQQATTYPEGTTPSKVMQTSGSDGEGHRHPQKEPSVSAPPKGDSYPNYSPQGPVFQGSHGEIQPTAYHQGTNQPPRGVPYPNPTFQGPFAQAQTPGPQQATEEDSSASPKEVLYPGYPPQNPYHAPFPQGPHSKGHPQTHPQGQIHPPAGPPYPSAPWQGPIYSPQAPGYQHPPGFGPRHPYNYQYPPGYPYHPGYPHISAPPPHQWPHPHQWASQGQYPQQHTPATEPPQGGEEPTKPQMSQPEDNWTDKSASKQDDAVRTCPGAQMQERAVRDQESPTPVYPTAKPNEADQPSVSQGCEEERTSDQENEEDKMAIEVTGLPRDELEKRRDVLHYYFENTKRSGGGDISQFDFDSEKDRVLIIFKDKDAPARVMQKSAHEVAKKKLTVRLVKPRRKQPVDPTRILLKGVADHVDEESLFLYLESMSKGEDEPSECFYGKEAGTIMVVFKEAISDLDTLLSRCEENELEGQKISAEKVHNTDCIQVTGIPPQTSRDKLFYYFESTKRSGGGPVVEVQLNKDHGTALVFFDEHTVIERVLTQSHTIQKTTVTVDPFYTCLGVTVAEAKTPPQLVPLPITENVTPPIASFVMNHERFKKALDDAMEAVNASISWPVGSDQDGIAITPTLTKETPNLASIAENWAPNAKEGLQSFLERFDTKEIADVMQASWPEVCKLIDGGNFKDDDTISVHSTSDKKIILTGLKDSVAKHYKRIMEGKEEIEEDIKRKQSEVDEAVDTLKPYQFRLLAMSDFKDRMTSKFPKLQMSFDTNGNKVNFHGLLDEIRQTKMQMFERMQGVTSHPVKLSPTLTSFLTSAKEPKQHLVGEYKENRVLAVTTTTTGTGEVDVCGLTEDDVKKAVSILKTTFQEQRLDVSDQSTSVLATEEWKTTKTALEQSAQGLLKISVERSGDSRATKILFTGESASVKDMMGRIDSYLKVKTVYEKRVQADNGVIRFIKDHQVANLKLQLEKSKVSVWFKGSEESPIMFIKGNTDGIQQADSILRDYINSVKSDQMSIKKPGMSKHFREQAGRSTLQLVERQCRCVIDIQDATNKTPAPDPDTFAKPMSPTIVPQEKAVVNLDDGKKLVVWRDDITKHKVDVIVNAANASLEHVGGLAKAIVDAGGDVIQTFCNDYIQAHGALIPGQVVSSPPGRIYTCQMIIHAVGPKWKDGSSREEDELADAVYGSLEDAARNNFRSIAIPAISSGVYGYPLNKCAETIVATTAEYLGENPDISLDVVEFVNINDQTADAFVDALVSEFGEDSVEKSDDKIDQVTTTPPKGTRSNRRRSGLGARPASPSTTTFTPPPQPRDPVAEVGFRTTEGKAITAIQANIASQNVDVLVNTTAGTLDLDTGAVSKAILQLAGSDLQKLVDKAKQSAGISSLPDGQILVTDSADLPCTQVIHCVLCSWDGGQGNSEKVLRKIVKQCLQQAEKSNHTSIAIPALGTGGLHFPHDVVAEAMFNEAVEHCRTNPAGSLREIRFIVWEGDPKSIPAFDEVMTKYKALHTDDAPQPTPTPEPIPQAEAASSFPPIGPGGRGQRGRKNRGNKTGNGRKSKPKKNVDPDNMAFATSSLFSEVSSPVSGELQMFIGDLTLNVRKGDLTKETTDCIVNSTNEQLDLTRGAVSVAICKAGGPDIEQECKNIADGGGMRDGIAVTGSGQLKCEKIIHAAAPASGKSTDWKKVITNCLQTADTLGLRSIAFPALGTGTLQGSVARTAVTMLEALQDFVLQYKPTKLNEVRITIFQQEMVRAFHEEMRKKVGQPLPKQPLPKKAAKSSGLFGTIGRAAAAGWSLLTGGQSSNTDNKPIRSADDVVVLVIYADRDDNLSEAKKMINKMMDDASGDEKIPVSIKLTEEQKDHVAHIAKSHDCTATFTRSNIRLQGRAMDVMAASRDINHFQHNVEMKAKEEKHLSDKAELFLKTVQWYYIDENEERQPYEPKVNCIIETAYLANKNGVDFQFEGENLHVDFKTMKETVVGDSAAAAVDVLRHEIEKEGTMKVPETWTDMADNDHSKEVELQPTSEEYKKVHDEFTKSIATAAPTAGYDKITTANVLKIKRIQNATLWKQYIVRKKEMELDNAKSAQPVERILYHGTPAHPIPSINLTGFNRSYSGINVGAAYGNGVYFAVTASLPAADQYARPDANGHRHIYMARVLSGDMCQGQQGIIVPPAKDPNKPHITYNSVCDNLANPQIIVIFYDTQAYPEYLITFTK